MGTEQCQRTEIATGWRLIRDDETDRTGAELSSRPDPTEGLSIPRMPATILRAMSDAGLTGDLTVGDTLTKVDRDLWQHDWWYVVDLDVPTAHRRHALVFDGITYRAEVWLNGARVDGPDSDTHELVGTYRSFELDITDVVVPGGSNTLAVRITPERRTPGLTLSDVIQEGDPAGVDLADTWADWINFAYHGDAEALATFLPDKNSGIVQRVWLASGGDIALRYSYVRTDLPLPDTDHADLTIHVDAINRSDRPVTARLHASVTLDGAELAAVSTDVALDAGEHRSIRVGPDEHPVLRLEDPKLWWPYTWGEPTLHHLEITATTDDGPSDAVSCDFGIRTVTGHRDDTALHPEFDEPGSFYLRINGRDYLVRGAAYTPDLLLTRDTERARTSMRYAKDLGVNLLRWEGHFLDDGMLNLADREGMPTMFGLMCCGAWERWGMWDEEDHHVAQESVRDNVRRLRSHASVVLWANGSDGLPPDEVLDGYRASLTDADWQNPVVDTASTRNRDWSGIHMNGPYAWRSPAFWFDSDNLAAMGSAIEEGNDETVPVLSTLEKFLPESSRWPFDDVWAMHTSSAPGNNELAGIRKVIDRRYGTPSDLADFAAKAQLAQYEATRALFEAYGARGWRTHKMTVYWMLNSPWPTFFGQLFDHYFAAGGAYYGAKTGLRPITAVLDAFAIGNHRRGRVMLVNHSPSPIEHTTVTARVYALDGALLDTVETVGLSCDRGSTTDALEFDRPDASHEVFFVRLTVNGADGAALADNTSWHSAVDDVPDLRVVDGVFDAMRVRQTQWADFRALASMPPVQLDTLLEELDPDNTLGTDLRRFRIGLHNPTEHLAFFTRVELHGTDGQELLPITYSDNYVTVYPRETVEVFADLDRRLIGSTPPSVATLPVLPALATDPTTTSTNGEHP